MYLSFQNFKKMIEETGRCSISGACEILHTLFDELEKLEDWDEENCLKISMRTSVRFLKSSKSIKMISL